MLEQKTRATLGEQIVENERGKIIGTRVVQLEGSRHGMELTFQSTGRLLGIDFNNTGTAVSYLKRGGCLDTEGRGIAMSQEGIANWTFRGISTPTGKGIAAKVRGCVTFETDSPKLERLNGLCCVVACDFDEDGGMRADLWELT